jgi:cardiolipin synthase A/B
MAVKLFSRRKKSADFLKNNKVKLLRSGSGFFTKLLELIDGAQESIHIQVYIFGDDETGRSVADALIRACERKVAVYVLVDAYGSQGLSGEFIDRLCQAGVYFRKFRPMLQSSRFYLGRRLHHKIFVIDSTQAFVAGLNLADRYNDTAEQNAWLDFALYVEGEVARALEAVCFRRLKVKPKLPNARNNHYESGQACPIRIRENDWASRKRQIYHTYLDMFRTAKSNITIISAYFLPGRTFRRAIKKAANRGVKVKVILTGTADVPLIKYAERYIYRWLFRNNIEVYEYQKNILHAKLATADGVLMTVGSFNVNNLSAYGSIECNLDVNDPGFVASVDNELEEIIKKDCIQVTAKDMRKKNVFVKLAHKIAYEGYRFMFFVSTKHRE